jgi:hypothetical protein
VPLAGTGHRRDTGCARRNGVCVDGAIDACFVGLDGGQRDIEAIDAAHREGDGWRTGGFGRARLQLRGRDARIRSVTGI